MVIRVENLNHLMLLKMIQLRQSKNLHNSLEYNNETQHFLRVLNSFSLHLK